MSSVDLLPLVIVAPLAGSAAALAGKLWKRADRAMSIVSVLSLAPVAVVLWLFAPRMLGKGGIGSASAVRYALGGFGEPYGIALVMDGFAWLSCVLVLVISLLVALAALSRSRYGSSFYFFLMLLIAGMFGVSLTGDLFTMFVAFEVVAIAAYVLIAYDRTDTGLIASFKYLMLSTVGILFFLLGVYLIYRDIGTLSISHVSGAVTASREVRDAPAVHLALAALCVGIGVRTAFIPFHTWLPEAHAYAPHTVSAILSGVLIKVSFFAMVRILFAFGGDYLSELLMWIGGVTAVVAVASALSQTDAKRLLAFHSISQMGYVLAVFGAGGALSLAAGFSHAINHALFKSLLFLTVGTAVQITGERNLFRMEPIGRKAPIIALAYLAGALSISGLPPWNGYASKGLISQVISGGPVYPFLWVTGFATIASFVKLSRIFLPARVSASADGAPVGPDARPGALLSAVAVVLALLCLATGLWYEPLTRVLHGLLSTEPMPPVPVLYTFAKIGWSALPVGLGVGLYLLVMTAPGKAVAKRIRTAAPELRTVLLLFFAGLIGFAVVAYF